MGYEAELQAQFAPLNREIRTMRAERESLLLRLSQATKLIEEGNLTLAILIDHETALRRIKSLDEKNVPKHAQQIASEALSRHHRS